MPNFLLPILAIFFISIISIFAFIIYVVIRREKGKPDIKHQDLVTILICVTMIYTCFSMLVSITHHVYYKPLSFVKWDVVDVKFVNSKIAKVKGTKKSKGLPVFCPDIYISYKYGNVSYTSIVKTSVTACHYIKAAAKNEIEKYVKQVRLRAYVNPKESKVAYAKNYSKGWTHKVMVSVCLLIFLAGTYLLMVGLRKNSNKIANKANH